MQRGLFERCYSHADGNTKWVYLRRLVRLRFRIRSSMYREQPDWHSQCCGDVQLMRLLASTQIIGTARLGIVGDFRPGPGVCTRIPDDTLDRGESDRQERLGWPRESLRAAGRRELRSSSESTVR
jgi:hypothetical protein